MFVGESLSAKASTLDINLDDSNVFTRIKSSGVCITTGTGSTSWYYSMNRLAPDYISILLRLLSSKIDNPELLENSNSLCSELADIYNKSLIFNAGKLKFWVFRYVLSHHISPQKFYIK